MLEKIGLPPKPSLRGATWVVDASHCQGCSAQFSLFTRKVIASGFPLHQWFSFSDWMRPAPFSVSFVETTKALLVMMILSIEKCIHSIIL
jgi:hypothetical protein